MIMPARDHVQQTADFIPGTVSVPNTKEGWLSLNRTIGGMSQETCEKILNGNKWAHNAMVLLDYRKEVCALCRSKGVPRFAW
jgi:hypothetical protein